MKENILYLTSQYHFRLVMLSEIAQLIYSQNKMTPRKNGGQLPENILIEASISKFSIGEDVSDAYLIPRQVTNGGIFICLQGKAEFFLDMKAYKFKAGDMCEKSVSVV